MSDLLNHFKNNFLDLIASYKTTGLATDKINVFVALSGGLDSVVLLDLITKCDFSNLDLTAVYVDHQLQPESTDWIGFNADLCKKYKIKYKYFTVDILASDIKSLGVEAAARKHRYSQLNALLKNNNDILCTAHHLDDQAETFLLQLTRAGSPKALAAMPEVKYLNPGLHLRPLLKFSRESITGYAKASNLNWVEDKTNSLAKYDRNYIRHNVVPKLSERWAYINNSIAKSAQYCAEYDKVLSDYLTKDLTVCSLSRNELDINKLRTFDFVKLKLLLRHWFEINNLPTPGEKVIKVLMHDFISSNQSVSSELRLNGKIIKKYKNKIILLPQSVVKGSKIGFDSKHIEFNYQLGTKLYIDKLGLTIKSKYISSDTNLATYKKGVLLDLNKENDLNIKFRQGGERCRPYGRGGSVSVKKILQENNIPPWQRCSIPLVYLNNEIISIPGIKNCEPYISLNNQGWLISCSYD